MTIQHLPTRDLASVVAANVRRAMRDAGISGVRMADLLDMAQSSWSRRETGKTPLTVDELWLVASILGRDPGWFYMQHPNGYDGARSSARSSTDRASDYGSEVVWIPRMASRDLYNDAVTTVTVPAA